MRVGRFAIAMLVGCAAAGSGTPGIDALGRSDSGDTGGDGGGGGTATACASGQFATDISASGQVTCTSPDPLTQQALADHCSVYLGWRDSCGACTTAPDKWGRAGTGSCSPGVGTNNTCTMPMLEGKPVHLFGLDLDGDVDENDKLHAGLHCTANTTNGTMAPCPAGQLVDGFDGASWTCSSFARMVITYVQANCSLYLGWQDNCGGCTTAPTKWGQISPNTCQNGAGIGNTCNAPTLLGTETVRLFGLSTDGNVDDNDKFHVALRCETPAPASSTQMTICPAGQFVAETFPDGSFRCESAAPSIARYFADRCTLYFGWQDGCDGCITPPSKWGKVRVGACTNGAGADNTCSNFTLGQSVDMFGLSPDGDVDENDALYVGFRCE